MDPIAFIIIFLFFLVGLLVGSFLNAAEYRLAHQLSVITNKHNGAARSMCPHCHKTLWNKDLIPLISYVLLGGMCRFCKTAISIQYPVVELATALMYVSAVLRFGLHAQAFVAAVFGTFLLFIFLYDLKHQLILDKISIPAIGIAFPLSWFVFHLSLHSMLIGAFIAGGFFALQYIASKGKWIGGGDIRLGVLMGIMLGWEQTLAALILAYVGGALIAVVLLLQKKVTAQTRIPFGTLLTVATYSCLLYGNTIIEWYI